MDYIDIKHQMIECFFVKKNVNFQHQLFIDYYDVIFPDYKEFVSFLSTSGKDSMIKHAKNIVERLLFDSPWNGMQNLYSNLLDLEEGLLGDTEDSYIHQDHAVHSVNLYLVGLYIYFNSSVFHRALSKYFRIKKIKLTFNCSNEENAFLGFLISWKGFSLLHDLAYPYERLFEGVREKNEIHNKYINEFYNIEKSLEYYSSLRYLSELILIKIIVQDSNTEIEKTFADAFKSYVYIDDYKRRMNFSNRELKWEGCKKLNYIYSNETFAFFNKWIRLNEFFVVIKDRNYNSFAFVKYKNNQNYICISRTSLDKKVLLQDIDKINIAEQRRRGLYFEFYTTEDMNNKIWDIIARLNLISRKDFIDNVCCDVRKRIMLCLASLSEYSTFSDIIYRIAQIISNHCPMKIKMGINTDNLIREQDILKKVVLGSMKKNVNDLLTQFYDELKTKNEGINTYNDKQIELIFAQIEKVDLKKLTEKCIEQYYDNKRKIDSIQNDYNEVFSKIICAFDSEQENDNLKNREQITYGMIEIEHEIPSVISELEELLKIEEFIQLDEKFEHILHYKGIKSEHDHGIAAGITIVDFVNKRQKLEEIQQGKNINRIFDNIYGLSQIENEMIYSVLVHNIYIDRYVGFCNNKPSHNLLDNPFSYFGMFCDNLQVWDRNKSLNHGLVEWTGMTLYGENISLKFEDSHVCILCQTSDIKQSFLKLKESLREYLQEADQIILLDLLEK